MALLIGEGSRPTAVRHYRARSAPKRGILRLKQVHMLMHVPHLVSELRIEGSIFVAQVLKDQYIAALIASGGFPAFEPQLK